MADLIDREYYCSNVCHCPGLGKGCSKEKCQIWQAPSIDPANLHPQREWISVEDRLPDIVSEEKAGRNTYRKSCRVLCACLQASGKQMVKEGYYYFFNDYPSPCWKIPGTIHSVTHWMPLPEPPDCGANTR